MHILVQKIKNEDLIIDLLAYLFISNIDMLIKSKRDESVLFKAVKKEMPKVL